MNLNDALTQIAAYAHLDADALIAFAAEDNVGGRNAGFDAWSIDADEGKVLYALVRALRPERILEIGVHQGASSRHLVSALVYNKGGRIYGVDVSGDSGPSLPDGHQDVYQLIRGDAAEIELPDAEFVFEDSQHSLDYSLKLFERLRNFARFVVTHDYAMTTAHGDFHVKEAFDTVFPDGMAFTLDGCERGMALWVNPEWIDINKPILSEHPTWEFGDGTTLTTTAGDDVEAVIKPPKPAPKPRTKRAPAKRTTKR